MTVLVALLGKDFDRRAFGGSGGQSAQKVTHGRSSGFLTSCVTSSS